MESARPFKLALSILLLALAGCAGAMNIKDAPSACASNPNGHVEVYIPDASVVRVLGDRAGRSGVHEGFVINACPRLTSCTREWTYLKVEDNVDITGPIPLQRGDAVSLLGQLECDDNVIHWTHHDPRGRHQSGYIKVNGKLYE